MESELAFPGEARPYTSFLLEMRGPERGSNLSKITQLAAGRGRQRTESLDSALVGEMKAKEAKSMAGLPCKLSRVAERALTLSQETSFLL